MESLIQSEDSSDIISESEYKKHCAMKVLKRKFNKYLAAWVSKKRNANKVKASFVIRANLNGYINRTKLKCLLMTNLNL